MSYLIVTLENKAFPIDLGDSLARVDWSIVAFQGDDNSAELSINAMRKDSLPDSNNTLSEWPIISRLALHHQQHIHFQFAPSSTASDAQINQENLQRLRAWASQCKQPKPTVARHPKYLASNATLNTLGPSHNEQSQAYAPSTLGINDSSTRFRTIALRIQHPNGSHELQQTPDAWGIHCTGSWSQENRSSEFRLIMTSFRSSARHKQLDETWLRYDTPVEITILS